MKAANVGKGRGHIPLDNASSVMIPFRRRGKRRRMQSDYEIEYKGRVIRCKTVEAATRILRALEEEDQRREERPWDADEFVRFTKRIRIPQRRVLKYLLDWSKMLIADSKLRQDLGIRNNQALAGVLSGLSKVALALRIEPERVYLQKTRFEKGKPSRYYTIAPVFMRAAQERGWPKDEDLKE